MGNPEDDRGDAKKEAPTQTAHEQSGETRREGASIPKATPSVRDLDFGERYRVLKAVGRGGMGEVYRAYDAELRREVALKVIREDRVDRDLALERFRREIALASKVSHRNVLRLYDLGENHGLRFLSMQFVDGDDLATLMRRERPLPLERALAIFRQVCEGLAAAHEQGVVHRDLKPQNVLVDRNDHVFVADFGLARSFDDSTVTATGTILGSPSYMSPEQVKGDPLDARSDVYSLGIMLYELLTGSTPFAGSSAHSIMEQRLHRAPRPVREVNPAVPSYLEGVLAKCIVLDPAKRYASVRDLLLDFDAARAPKPATQAPSRRRTLALAAGVAGALLVGLIVWRLRGGDSGPAQAPSAASSLAAAGPAPGLVAGAHPFVLILGFENRTGDPVFDGTIDDILEHALFRSPTLEPFAGNWLRQLAAEVDPEPQPLDERLAAKVQADKRRRVISVRGVVEPKGAAVAISMTVAEAGKPILTETTDPVPTSRVVATIAKLACDLRAAVGDDPPKDPELAAQTSMSPSVEADHEFTVARALAQSGNDRDAIPHFERTLALDPDFGNAHFALAVALGNEARDSESLAEYKLGLKWMDRLSEREKLEHLGLYYDQVGDAERGIAAYEELLQKWPDNLRGQVNLPNLYRTQRNMARALELGVRAAANQPKNVIARSNVSQFYVLANDFEAAVREARRTIQDFAHPDWEVYSHLGIAAALLGHRDEAVETYQKLEAIDSSLAATAQADLALAEGRLSDAAAILDKGIAADIAQKLPDRAAAKWAMLGEVRLRRNDKAGALEAADKAAATGEPPALYSAAVIQLAGGADKKALSVASRLSQALTPDPRIYAKLLEGESLRLRGKASDAGHVIEDAQHIADSWLGHMALGRAYLDAGAFAQAYSELTTCLKRKGEGAMLFLDEVPTLRYLPQVTYYVARAQEGLGSPDAAQTYKAFLAMEPNADHDPLVDDARRRVAPH